VLANLLRGIAADELTFTLSTSGDAPIGRVRGALTHSQLGPDARIPVEIPVARRRGLANAGVLNTEALGKRLRMLLREGGVTGLSPIVVDDIDILPGMGLFVSGRVEPQIEMLRGPILDFQVRGNELIVFNTFQGGDLRHRRPHTRCATASSAIWSTTGWTSWRSRRSPAPASQ